ncbi:MAG: pentapeptide repeat-containing protein [Cyanobacteria bacterium J06634_6]
MNYQQLLEDGVEHWNLWRAEHPALLPDLGDIDLSHHYLFEVNFQCVNLSGANLSRACLIGANLSGADLSEANLAGAYLSEANLLFANLHHANLRGASLSLANLSQANLFEAQIDVTELAKALPAPVKREKALPIAIEKRVLLDEHFCDDLHPECIAAGLLQLSGCYKAPHFSKPTHRSLVPLH